VGTIYNVKNYSFLVDCFAEVAKDIENISLTIVGDGVLRGEIDEQVKKSGIADKVRITGVVSDVENYLADADVYVASSIFEGLPISMLEAMSAGLPIISTNVGGVPDIIKHGENGILVAPGDKNGYVQALRELINDETKRREYAERAKLLSAKYDEKITVEGYEKLYQG
jgi:glycosyltransferase involved in cell wall biosynthesis